MITTSPAQRLAEVLDRIRKAEKQFQREPDSVNLLAVSKTKPSRAIAEAVAAGQRRFGENYLQEALEKMQELQRPDSLSDGLSDDLEWHFIGPIQSNKTRRIAENFSWVHSVDRLKIAQRLADQRPRELPPLNICLEVNVDQETSKSGFSLEELATAAPLIAELPGLRLRGLMAIPEARSDFAEQRKPFARLREAQQQLIDHGLMLDTLSMGMTADLEAAIAEGATIVRIGTAIFGPREPH